MAEALTERQREILDFITASINERGYPPTLREIGTHFGIRSTNGVNDHLRALEKKGYLQREDLKSRALRPVSMIGAGAAAAKARAELPAELAQHLRTLRGITTKPICVGFGIGTPAQAAAAGQAADGVIVGSAIVQLIEKHAGQADLVTKIGDFIASLKEPLRSAGEKSRA